MKALFYILKVWFITTILAPVIYGSWLVIKHSPAHYEWGDLDVLVVVIMTGMLISLPLIPVMIFLYSFIRFNPNKIRNLIIMSVVSVLGILIAFWLLDKSLIAEAWGAVLAYSLITVLGLILFYPKYEAEME